MKTAVKILSVLAVLLLPFRGSADPVAPKATIALIPVDYQDLCVIKVDRKLKGAMVEIYYSNGDLIASRPLEKRKMIINFRDVGSGLYTIRVTKNKLVEEFHYQRK